MDGEKGMSMKIYYGHKYNGTWEELLRDLKLIREEYRPKVRELYTKVINKLKDTDEVCDYNFVYCEKQNGMKFKDFTPFDWATFLEGKIRGGLKGPLNVGASIVIYPFDGGIYLLPFIGNKYDALSEISDKFQEYGYWDNTDRPASISDEEWDERARVWTSVIHYGEPYNSCGFSYDLYTEEDVLITVLNLEINRRKPEDIITQE